jgi:hypothetical protein
MISFGIESKYKHMNVWIGGKRNSYNRFEWINGKAFNYTNWDTSSGQPVVMIML